MKHPDRSHHPPQHQPRGLRSLLRPGPRPWFHRPRPAAPEPHHGQEVPSAGPATLCADEADFQRLVALYRRSLQLRDRALAETRVGEDALSIGDELKATQHFEFGGHYRRRADEVEAAIERLLATLQATGGALAAEALRVARERRYGSPEADTRPEFA